MNLITIVARGRGKDHPIRRRSIEEILQEVTVYDIADRKNRYVDFKTSDSQINLIRGSVDGISRILETAHRLEIDDEHKKLLFQIFYDVIVGESEKVLDINDLLIRGTTCDLIEGCARFLDKICLSIEDSTINNHAVQFAVYSTERYLYLNDPAMYPNEPAKIEEEFDRLKKGRKSIVRDFVKYLADHDCKPPKTTIKEKTFIDDEAGVAATSRARTEIPLSSLETLIFYLAEADPKKFRKRKVPTKKSKEVVFKALTTHYIGNNFDLLETYVDVLEEDYEDRDIALECLELFLEKEYEMSRQGAYTGPPIPDLRRPNKEDLRTLSRLLKTKPGHNGFYRLIKSAIMDGGRIKDTEARIMHLKNNPNMREDYYEYLARVWDIRHKRQRAMEIIEKGETREATELEECTDIWIANYFPISKIGQGQTRKVFKVRRESTNQILALKIDIPEDEVSHPRAKEVIQLHPQSELSKRERTALLELTHENLARMWDFGVCRTNPYEERNYIVEDFVDGITLEDLVKQRGRLDILSLIPIFGPVARAARYLRERRFVHRDIKPDNILISHDLRTVKLTDLQTAVRTNNSGEYIDPSYGSLRTMAPEVISTNRATFVSDLYSIGVCMFYALTGEMPYNLEDPNYRSDMALLLIKEKREREACTWARKRIEEDHVLGYHRLSETAHYYLESPNLIDEDKRAKSQIFSGDAVLTAMYYLMTDLISLDPAERLMYGGRRLEYLERLYARHLMPIEEDT